MRSPNHVQNVSHDIIHEKQNIHRGRSQNQIVKASSDEHIENSFNSDYMPIRPPTKSYHEEENNSPDSYIYPQRQTRPSSTMVTTAHNATNIPTTTIISSGRKLPLNGNGEIFDVFPSKPKKSSISRSTV
ncbi:unnamed protein product [Didymodactylos carnosus]|uniref:Uncharacterized protein n=1 Tax=Didymodactylos carnosus TaxID=1234261 RepID=A0A815N7K7_9BILA|nr:unnamed protein product [Didymodactylos carnosus]CAF1430250.1 unnamed protein product [Didymodactylos carnosus]CAF4002129.1 unnamed protein product [Didymodactylos carnosus]CAF4309185.1 unnamed protein product [Didymodactylos carnosus]